MTDVLVMYSEVTRAITGEIKFTLTPEEEKRLASARQVNPEAYDAYLKGQSHWYKLTTQELNIALQYYELALEIDPNYALAHAGVALVWVGRYQINSSSRDEAVPLAKAAAEKAVELDSTLAETHYALAGVRTWSEWDWEGAEIAFQKAIEINPNFPDVRAYYAHFLCHMGRTEEALMHIEGALELDKANPLFHALYGVVLLYLRRFDDALAAARTSHEIFPGIPVAGAVRWLVFMKKSSREEKLDRRRAGMTSDPELVAAFERGFEEGGYECAQRVYADVWASRYGKPGRRVTANTIASMYITAGAYDQAIDWLEKAYEEHDPNLPYLGMPDYDPLRPYPRFQDLLRKMNLPVEN
jgi:tetratricopeptide (TPR) repeat protein